MKLIQRKDRPRQTPYDDPHLVLYLTGISVNYGCIFLNNLSDSPSMIVNKNYFIKLIHSPWIRIT